MSSWTAEIRAYGRDVALATRHLRMAGGRLWRRAQGEAFGFLEARSPTIHRRLLRLRGSRAEKAVALPHWGSTVTLDGITMRIDERLSDHNVLKLVSGRHTKHERDLLAQVLESDDVVMELGGGIGMVAIACAKKVGSERVFSYEANPELESLMRDNYALNRVEPRLKMCMLGAAAGSRTFHIARRFSRSSVFDTDPESRPVEVPVEPFNAEIRRIQPTVLVVDIQGGEAELVSYADLSTVKKLLIEIHSDIIGLTRAHALRRDLRRMGFIEKARAGQSFLYVRDGEREGAR